jgi:acyl carrier protein phosphodiesterase
MNFLAHSHLSGNNRNVLFGNFVADGIKGGKFENYPEDIKTGILLHRQIDSFTDSHPLVKSSTALVRQDFGKFSGVAVDIFYDHFLAANWTKYSDEELSSFVRMVYLTLLKRYSLLPPKHKRILPFMLAKNWLVGYANTNDLNRIFQGMDRRTNYISGMGKAVEVLLQNYNELKGHFETFYPELQKFAENKLIELTKVK